MLTNGDDKKIWCDAEKLHPDDPEKQREYRRRRRIDFEYDRKNV